MKKMKVKTFLDKKTPKEIKIKVLEEMLAAAEAADGTLSVVNARKIIKATSAKPQAPSATKKPQMIFKTILEFEKDKT
tara:strand:- start:90 stop:323 length:234 start_codon:yes stop_codon:yes gene_type:complete